MNYYDLEISFGKRNIIGYVGENEVVRVIFDVKEWEDKFGLADSFVLTVQTSENYPVPITYENGKVYWVVENDTLAQKGYGALQLTMLKDEQVKKSAIAEIVIKNSLETGATPPGPYESWVEDMTENIAVLNNNVTELGNTKADKTEVETALATKVDKATEINGHPLSSNVTITKADIGLGNADNTSDLDKPISTATQSALNTKADISTVATALSTKANIDGYYESLSVGTADNLIDRKGNGTLHEFVRRTSCGDESITDDGTGVIQSIHGKTLVFNQLIKRIPATTTREGVTFTNNGDGSITANGTSTGTAYANEVLGKPTISGHKYFLRGCPAGGSTITYSLRLNAGVGGSFETNTQDTGNGAIISVTNGSISANYSVLVYNGTTVNNLKFVPQIFDLTAMFGAGNEPTIDEFTALLPESYYPYNAGELINFMGMKSAGSVYDELTPDKAVTRIGKVDLGSLDWTKQTSSGGKVFFRTANEISEMIKCVDNTTAINILSSKYDTSTWNLTTNNADYDKVIGGGWSGKSYIAVADSSYSSGDETAFKTAMSGVILQYELATPTETPISPPLNLSYKVADFGTETVDDGNLITDGYNQWDEEWELGSIDENGQNATASDKIRSKNYIPVFPSTTYYFKIGTSAMWLWGYDINKNYVGRVPNSNSLANTTVTMPDNVCYIRFVCRSQYGTSYNNDICMNLSWSGYRNGEYEPYWKRTLDLCVDNYFTDDNPQNMPYAPFNAVIKYSMDYAREVPRLRTQVDDLIARVTALEG